MGKVYIDEFECIEATFVIVILFVINVFMFIIRFSYIGKIKKKEGKIYVKQDPEIYNFTF